ncbi:MAG: FAD-binding oxidoreductase [Chloroflexi bacterium]|nr:FAD-binding oxidoreductase [Chloroflexota bacterium]
MTNRVIDDVAIESLRAEFRGALLRPGDDGYDAARQVWNAMVDRRPALIARCTGVADVLAAVAFARDQDLLLAVRGGGHNVAGNAVCDDGVVVDLSLMKGIRVDPVARTAWAEGGVTWGELDHETQTFGLATTGGTVSMTGIAGLTLGGGFGWLMRKHGLACDNLLAAEVVTADGRFLRCTATEHPDLFWALRGGGGNFGVVTGLEYQLHPVGPIVLAGPLFHPLDAAGELLRFFRDSAPTLPEAMGCMAALLTSPDGNPLSALVPVYTGPLDEGEAAVQPLRQFGSPVADLVGPMPYRAAQMLFDAAFPAGQRNYWKSSFLPGLADVAIDVLADHFRRAPSPHAGIAIELFGGAVSRVAPEETAFAFRDSPFNVIIFTAWDEPAEDLANISWARELWSALQPFATDAVYVNYLGDVGDEGRARVRAAYGDATYERLAALKRAYDPENLFRMNQNIAPA